MIKVSSQLNQYFKGARQTFDLKVDLNMSTFFYKYIRGSKKIPYGSTGHIKTLQIILNRPGDIEQLQMQMLEILFQ